MKFYFRKRLLPTVLIFSLLLLAACGTAPETAKPADGSSAADRVSLIRGEQPGADLHALTESQASSDSAAYQRAAAFARVFGQKNFISLDPSRMPAHYRGFYVDEKHDLLHIYCTKGQAKYYKSYFPDDPHVVIEESAYSYTEHHRILQELWHVPGLAFCQDVQSQPDRFVLIAWADTAELAESFILNNPHFKDYVAHIDIYKNSAKWADLIAEHQAHEQMR